MNHFHKIVLILCVCVISCNNDQKESTSEVTDSVDSSTANIDLPKNSISSDTLSEDFIIDTIFSVKEVKKADKNIDKVTNHKHGISIIIEKPDADEKDYYARVGYNGEERFQTYYNFYINPITKQITIDEPVSGERLSLEEWRKIKK